MKASKRFPKKKGRKNEWVEAGKNWAAA